jgi:hypothetical protein
MFNPEPMPVEVMSEFAVPDDVEPEADETGELMNEDLC